MSERTGIRFAQLCFANVTASSLRYALIVTSEPPSHIDRARIGVCVDCAHARRIESSRGSQFYFCGLSLTDENFPKYPRLPVLECEGFSVNSGNTQNQSE
jgi:hypothetical protein